MLRKKKQIQPDLFVDGVIRVAKLRGCMAQDAFEILCRFHYRDPAFGPISWKIAVQRIYDE